MDDKYGGADYKKSHRMVFGNLDYIEKGKSGENYNLDVITYSNDLGKITKDEEEAFIIGNDIINKINNKFQVFDKKKEMIL